MEIALVLKKGWSHAQYDKILFQRWERKEIEIPQVIRLFRWNNGVRENFHINENDFIYWLNSLGYKRDV